MTTGPDITIDRIVRIYSDPDPDPGHVFAYDNGEIRQQFNICCACTITDGTIQVSTESTTVEFHDLATLDELPIHESIRIRIRDYIANVLPVLR